MLIDRLQVELPDTVTDQTNAIIKLMKTVLYEAYVYSPEIMLIKTATRRLGFKLLLLQFFIGTLSKAVNSRPYFIAVYYKFVAVAKNHCIYMIKTLQTVKVMLITTSVFFLSYYLNNNNYCDGKT